MYLWKLEKTPFTHVFDSNPRYINHYENYIQNRSTQFLANGLGTAVLKTAAFSVNCRMGAPYYVVWRCKGRMSMELKAELVMAVRGYECEGKQDCGEGVDLTASDTESDEKILLRIISDSGSNSGTVGVEAVRRLVEAMKQENCDKGVIVGERFSEAARKETARESIEIVSENLMPFFSSQEMYFAMEARINHLCKKKCRRIPKKRSDCKGKDSEGHYSCRVRQINDNAMFHLQRGWTDLLREDFLQILALERSAG